MEAATAVQQEPKPIATIQQRPAFSLLPQNLTEAMKLAELMASSDLVPKDYRGKPGNVLIAVQMGQEVGLGPMAAVQSIAVINSKPGLYGDAGKAILLKHGCQIEEDDIALVKTNGRGRCKITRPGHPPCERTFSIDNAKTAKLWGKEGPWTQYPERQMAWRAFWFAARDVASDLLKGLGGAEEFIDLPPEREINPIRQTGAEAAAAARTTTTTIDAEQEKQRADLIGALETVAKDYGLAPYAEEWSKLSKAQRKLIGEDEHARLKKLASAPREPAGETVAQGDREPGQEG